MPTVALLAALLLPCAALRGQGFDSGSDGSDGALDLSGTAPGATVELAPDGDGDNVYHFTSVSIPDGVTLRLTVRRLQMRPVWWLVSGPVVIDGTVDLSGAEGQAGGDSVEPPEWALPGPGGFPGGLGGIFGVLNPTGGFGPTGGLAGAKAGAGGGWSGSNGFLLPLAGGSGGSGGNWIINVGTSRGGGGGAGGGALLIASSVSIALNGTLDAAGGHGGDREFGKGYPGGPGGGGAIRVLAPTISGNGSIDVSAGRRGNGDGGASGYGEPGFARIETTERAFTGSFGVPAAQIRIVVLTDAARFLPPEDPPLVRIARIAGQNVPPNPTGSFTVPDVAVDESAPVTLEVAASHIPLGTELQLFIINENDLLLPPEQTRTGPLAGTLASSTAAAEVTLPPGFSRLLVRATWAPGG